MLRRLMTRLAPVRSAEATKAEYELQSSDVRVMSSASPMAALTSGLMSASPQSEAGNVILRLLAIAGVIFGPRRTVRRKTHYQVRQVVLANLVGAIALGLPIGLWLVGRRDDICQRDSISHFYYSEFFGSVFVASLAMIAAFMWAYSGKNWRHSLAATGAGICALGVALFPTSGHGCAGAGQFDARAFASFDGVPDGSEAIALAPSTDAVFRFQPFAGVDWFSDAVHYGSAGLLFAFLTWYCFWVFAAASEGQQTKDGLLTWRKLTRNLLYYLCGAVLFVALIGLAGNFLVHQLALDWPRWHEVWAKRDVTFWLEFWGLVAFGFAWIVKGRLFGLALYDRYRGDTPVRQEKPFWWA